MEDILDAKLNELEGLSLDHPNKAMSMVKADNSSLYTLDLLAIAVFKRSMSLISGFCSLIRSKNFICAAPLVRLQIDNALRLYATSLVKEPHELAKDFIGGIPIKEFKDEATGKKLSDRYLVEKLSEKFGWLSRVYKESSGYIHLSEKHFFNATTLNSSAKLGFSMTVGADDILITVEERIDAANAMIAVTKIVLWLLDSWTHNKNNPGIKEKQEQASV